MQLARLISAARGVATVARPVSMRRMAAVRPRYASTSSGASSAGGRPFRVLGVQQVAIGGLDKGRLGKLWVDTLGLERVTTYRSEKENVDEDVLKAGRGPFAVEVDIMQPLNKDKSPKVHDPPLNHIGLWVDDLPAAVKWLTEQGVRFAPGGIRKGATGLNITFIHPKGNEASPLSGEGVLIELVQAPPEVIAAYEQLK
jgi:lactoylglutathione lyase